MGECPEDCNGLELIDRNAEFSKFNCRWVKRNSGRPVTTVETKATKKRLRSKLKEPRNICLVLEKNLLDYIRSQALYRSSQEGMIVEANDLIRDALERAFPVPQQMDMFSCKKKAKKL